MAGYQRYLVSLEWSPSSVVHTPSSRPCPGCSKCVYCKKNELPVYPFYDTREPKTFNNDLQKQVTVQRQETRTTDINEKVFQKGEKCFYKSKFGPFQEAIITKVDNSVTPISYEVQILAHYKDTDAGNLYREIPQYHSEHEMSHDPVHETQSDHIVAENNGPWSQSNEQLNNQLNKSKNFPSIKITSVRKHTLHEPQSSVYLPSMMTHNVHKYKPSGPQPNIATQSPTVRGKLSSESAVRSRRAGLDTSTAEPRFLDDEWNPIMYPEAEFGCMSLKSLYQ